jgi:hypothetical protein
VCQSWPLDFKSVRKAHASGLFCLQTICKQNKGPGFDSFLQTIFRENKEMRSIVWVATDPNKIFIPINLMVRLRLTDASRVGRERV